MEPTCESCGKKIPTEDLAAFAAEAGDPEATPTVCDDCAEDES